MSNSSIDIIAQRTRRRDDDYSDSEKEYLRARPDQGSRKDEFMNVRSRSHRSRRRDSNDGNDRDDSRHRRRDRRDYDSRQDCGDKASKRHSKYRDRSTSRERSRHHKRSRSPAAAKTRKRSRSTSSSPPPNRRSHAPLPSQNEIFNGNKDVTTSEGPPVEKQKPNFKPSGLLAKEANTVAGTTSVLKYHEPPEARKPPPKDQWRMYVFKKKDLLDTIYLHQRSAWLMGRDQHVTDLLLEHPSISKQHAVIQFRYNSSTNEFGDKRSRVKPYLIDLESANGTKLNGKKVDASRYVELVDGDVFAFGDSGREYVLMLPPSDTKGAM